MHRSIKQHMVRNAKFTCFSKKKKKKQKKTTHNNNNKPQKTQKQNKTQIKPWGLQQKKSY